MNIVEPTISVPIDIKNIPAIPKMIDFSALPIYLHMPSMINTDDLAPLEDGIHYYINANCSASQYMEILRAIIRTLDISMNDEGSVGAGCKHPLVTAIGAYHDLQMTDAFCDVMHKAGFNPIKYHQTFKLIIFGNQFVHKGQIYPFFSMNGQRTRRPDNLIMFASQYNAYTPEADIELIRLQHDRSRLMRELDVVNGNLSRLQGDNPSPVAAQIDNILNELVGGIVSHKVVNHIDTSVHSVKLTSEALDALVCNDPDHIMMKMFREALATRIPMVGFLWDTDNTLLFFEPLSK